MKPYYYIYKVGGPPPEKKHNSLESAQKESMRLSLKHPGYVFEILVCIGITQTTTPQTFWMDGVELEGEL